MINYQLIPRLTHQNSHCLVNINQLSNIYQLSNPIDYSHILNYYFTRVFGNLSQLKSTQTDPLLSKHLFPEACMRNRQVLPLPLPFESKRLFQEGQLICFTNTRP